MVIAIDGPAGSGKSTIAKLLAEKLKSADGNEFSYINSGNLYRAITFGCLKSGINPSDSEKVIEFAKNAQISYSPAAVGAAKKDQVFLKGENITESLHTDEIDKYSAPLSAIVSVRHIVNDLIRSLAKNRNIVVEGRDMTSVVFPDADFRFYLDASADSRAKRRFEQGVSTLSLEEIKRTIMERDQIDKNKVEGNLKLADGVQYLDTSDLTIIEVYEKLIEEIEKIH
jgi:cytidylate kinase